MGWLYTGKVYHRRNWPKVNEFSYRVFYLNFPLTKIENLKRSIFSIDGFNLLSFYNKDHAGYDAGGLYQWASKEFAQRGIEVKEIFLQTFPRVLGYVFIPVSFWYAKNNENEIIGIMAEVNNTFGGSYHYFFDKKGEPITSEDTFNVEKKLHVSPFNDVEGEYEFNFYVKEDVVAKVTIKYLVNNQLILYTHIEGRSCEFNTMNLLKCFFKIPFMTLKIFSMIHYQALKLFLKGVPFVGATPKKNIE